MSKPFLTHIAWLAAVGASFFAGGKLVGGKNSLEQASTAPRTGVYQEQIALAPEKAAIGTMNVPELTVLKQVEDFMKRYASVKGNLTPEQMQAAIAEVLTEGDPVKSSLMFSLLLEKLTPENAAMVLKEVQSKTPGFEGMRYIGLLAFKWGGMDGPAAMEQAMKQQGPARFVGMAGLAGWAGKDPSAAAKWLSEQKLDNGFEKGMMTRSLISGLARTDAEQAVDYVSKLTDKDERTRMTQAVAEEKMKQGVDAAGAWALSLKDPDMKKGAFESVADQLYRGDKTKAGEYVKANASQPFAVNAAGEMGRRLAQENPQDALGFAKDLPAGDSRTKAYSGTFREWANKDPEAASGMLQNMPAGADRDGAAAGLATSVTKDEPEAGLAWAEAITSPELRQSTLNDVLRIQYATNPDGAVSYMSAHGWTPEQQDSVRIRKDERPRFPPFAR